ncbi:hypothetical protein [Shewanella sp. S1-58-MNA-CIBAN-0166]|uniref:hypothetical protein n=1 Tax=Shewanella sp. S1-58-MNA-CIBAN-0166 TaxID=3140467 RepID=UPI00332855CA
MPNIEFVSGKPQYDFQGCVTVDCDVLAERCVVFNHKTMTPIRSKAINGTVIRFRLPLKYTTRFDLCVIIVDANTEYNAAILDGVQAEIIDANLVKI